MLEFADNALLTRITALVASYNREQRDSSMSSFIVTDLNGRDLVALFKAYPEKAFELLSGDDSSEHDALITVLVPAEMESMVAIFTQAGVRLRELWISGEAPVAEGAEDFAARRYFARCANFISRYEARAFDNEVVALCTGLVGICQSLPFDVPEKDLLLKEKVFTVVTKQLVVKVYGKVLEGLTQAYDSEPFFLKLQESLAFISLGKLRSSVSRKLGKDFWPSMAKNPEFIRDG